MAYNTKSQQTFIFIIIFCTFFNYVKLEIIKEDLILNNINITTVFNEPKYFYITHVEPHIPKNIKIQIEGKNKNNDYIISYYKNDSKFINRSQLSKSFLGKTFMYLNKYQIEKDFYLSIECYEYPCEYSFNLTYQENMELTFGEQYTYYVTEDNKIMTFIIKGRPEIKYEYDDLDSRKDYKISIWAKGNQEINTKLNGDFRKYKNKLYKKMNSYIIYMNKLEDIYYTFLVVGNVGDLINIGTIFFSGENICQTPIEEFGLEISGVFIKDFMESVSFLFPIIKGQESKINQTESPNIISYFNVLLDFESSFYGFDFAQDLYDDKYNLYSFIMDININKNDYFYSFQYNINNQNNNFHLYSPAILGSTNQLFLNKGDTIGFIPMQLQNDFNYLTYQTKEFNGIHKASIFICDQYPFCKNSNLKNETSLISFNTTTIIYNQKEYDNNISPISQYQKILLLKCESKFCSLFTSIYTEKDQVTLLPSFPYHKYIKKNCKENYVINLNTITDLDKVKWYINIDIISGNITTEFVYGEKYNYKNKIFYEIESETEKDYLLKINANKNSFYSISINIENLLEDEELSLMPQMNYLFKLDKNSNEKSINFFYNIDKNFIGLYYLQFFSLNCDINTYLSYGNKIKNINRINNSYEYIFDPISIPKDYNGFKIKKVEKEKEICLFGISIFRYINHNNTNLINGIFLSKKISHTFNLEPKYNMVKYIYLHTEINNDINININTFEDIIYTVILFLNDKIYNTYNYTNNNNEIKIKSDSIKEKCQDNLQPCKVEFIIKGEKIKNKSTIEVLVNTFDNSKNKMFLLILCFSILTIIIILIIITIFLIYKKKKKSFYRLKNESKSISFQKDEKDINSNQLNLNVSVN